MLYSPFITVNDFSLEIGIKVTGVTKHLQEATDSFLSFVLGLSLYIYAEMRFVQLTKNPIK